MHGHRADPDGPAGADRRRSRDRSLGLLAERRTSRSAASRGRVARAGLARVLRRARCASCSSSAGFAATRSCAARRRRVATSRPLRARRAGRGAAADARRSDDFQALAVALQARQEHRRELADGTRRSIATALTEPAELRAARRARRAAAAASSAAVAGGGLRARASRRSPALRPVVDRFFTEVFVMADDAALQDRAPDADGATCAT